MNAVDRAIEACDRILENIDRIQLEMRESHAKASAAFTEAIEKINGMETPRA